MAPASSRCAGFLRKYFASGRRGRATSGKAKNNERNLNYENSENYIYDDPLCARLLRALPTSAKRHRHTRSRFYLPKQHGRWGPRPCGPNHWHLQLSLWFLLTPEQQRRQLQHGCWRGTLLSSDGTQNTAVGAGALLSNTDAGNNTAVGTFAMFVNSTGADNTAVGDEALEFNVSAVTNAAVGTFALQNNDSSGAGTADFNTAVGGFALLANVDGTETPPLVLVRSNLETGATITPRLGS